MVKKLSGVPTTEPNNQEFGVDNPAAPTGCLLEEVAVKPQALNQKRLHDKARNSPMTFQVQAKTILSIFNPMSTSVLVSNI